MEVRRLATGVATWRHGALKVCLSAVGAAAWRHGALEPWRRCGPGGVEVRSARGALQRVYVEA